MASIFSKIVAGDIPCYKIYESDKFLAFLDIAPMSKGHTLLIPKAEVDYIFDVDDSTLAEMMLISKKIAKGIEKVVPCKRVGVAVIGLEVPHAHIHLIPINKESDMLFNKEKLQLSKEEMSELCDKISKAIIND